MERNRSRKSLKQKKALSVDSCLLTTAPLPRNNRRKEDQRVQELMSSRSAKRKLQRALDAETLQGRRLFKMLPDAFVFNYAGGDGNLVQLSFRPNPNFIRPLWRPAFSTTWKARCGSTASRSDWLRLMPTSHRT